MKWRKRQPESGGHPDAIDGRILLARLESVVDRLEGVYELMAADNPRLPSPNKELGSG